MPAQIWAPGTHAAMDRKPCPHRSVEAGPLYRKSRKHAKTWNPVQREFMGGSAPPALWPAAYFTTKKSLALSSGLLSSRANWIAAPAPVPSGSYRSAPVVVL